MERLEGYPVRWLSWDYRIVRDGEELTVLDLATFRSRGDFVIDGARYELRPEGAFRKSFVLEQEGRVLARAERLRAIPGQYHIVAGDRQLHLGPRFPGRTYFLRHGDRIIGQVQRQRLLFSRAFTAEFTEVLPVAIELFVLALVVQRWRARARSR